VPAVESSGRVQEAPPHERRETMFMPDSADRPKVPATPAPPTRRACRGCALIVSLVLLGVGLSSQGQASSTATEPQDSSMVPPQVERINERFYRVGNVLLDSGDRTLYVPARVNMSEGLVELLACGEMGKTHESVLVVDAQPWHIQVSLLLLGLEPGGGLEYQGDPQTPKGDSVWIWVEWADAGSWKMVRGEDLVFDSTRTDHMEYTAWVFSGSLIVDGRFAAGIEQSIVTTYHDPMTILDNPLPSGGDDTVYYVNSSVVPAVGHPVVLIFRTTASQPTSYRAAAGQVGIKLKGDTSNASADSSSEANSPREP
jgi:hypothetical protein